MATIQELLARKAAEEKAASEAGKANTQEEADRISQSAERLVENQRLDPNSPQAIKEALEKQQVVAKDPQAAINQDVTKVLGSENLIDHQGNVTSLDTPVATGMQDSVSGVHVRANDPRLLREGEEDIRPNDAKMRDAKGVFRAVDIIRYFRANGQERRAVDGFFYAKDDEDMKMMDHFIEQGAVTKYEGGSASTSSDPKSTATDYSGDSDFRRAPAAPNDRNTTSTDGTDVKEGDTLATTRAPGTNNTEGQ